jgi:hypothetical protein
MATTTNFGWDTPDDTDLVKDGAAAIRTALNGVDTSFVDLKGGTTGQVLAKNSDTDLDFVWSADAAGMTNPMTTTGDIIYSSPGSTPVRLAVGSTDDVLTVAGGVPTWAAPAGAGQTWSLLNAGGTALTGSTTITISGISDKNNLLIIFAGASSANATSTASIRFNTDTGSNYTNAGTMVTGEGSYDASSTLGTSSLSTTSVILCRMSSDASSVMNGAMSVYNCNSTSYKTFIANAGGNAPTSSNNYSKNVQGFYEGTSAISSVSLISSTGNWDAGTLYVYGA